MHSLLTKMFTFKLTISVCFLKKRTFLSNEHAAEIACIICGHLGVDKFKSLQLQWAKIIQTDCQNSDFLESN